MLKRMMLAVAFVAALGIGGLGITSAASAYGGCYRGHGGGFHGGPHAAYRSYGYGPRVYSRAYYPSYYGGYGYRSYGYRGYGGYGGAYIPFGGHHRGGVYFGVGF